MRCRLFALLLAACSSSPPIDDAGALDANVLDGNVRDDAPAFDAPQPDSAVTDASSDAFIASPDIMAFREHYCDPAVRAICHAVRACRCTPWPGLHDWPWDEDHCFADHSDFCTWPTTEGGMIDAIAGGHADLDHDALSACEERVRASAEACSVTPSDWSEWCWASVIDHAAIGEICRLGPRLCAAGNGICDIDPDHPFDPSTCIARPARGESCSMFCMPGSVCRAGTCVAPSALGEACIQDADCSAGICVGGACRASLVAEGGACIVTSDCVNDNLCQGSVCVRSARPDCSSLADCGSLADCWSPTQAICKATQVEGDSCDVDFFASACGVGLMCEGDSTDGPFTCRTLPSAGEPCSVVYQACASDAYCDPFSRQCQFLPELGEPCARYTDGCASGLACFDHVCDYAAVAGRRCADDYSCAVGLVCDRASLEGTCIELVGGGETCSPFAVPTSCVDGFYCDDATSRCLAEVGMDEECSTARCGPDLDCHYSYFDDPGEWRRVCRPLGAPGSDCSLDCEAGVSCIWPANRCEPSFCDALFHPERDYP